MGSIYNVFPIFALKFPRRKSISRHCMIRVDSSLLCSSICCSSEFQVAVCFWKIFVTTDYFDTFTRIMLRLLACIFWYLFRMININGFLLFSSSVHDKYIVLPEMPKVSTTFPEVSFYTQYIYIISWRFVLSLYFAIYENVVQDIIFHVKMRCFWPKGKLLYLLLYSLKRALRGAGCQSVHKISSIYEPSIIHLGDAYGISVWSGYPIISSI